MNIFDIPFESQLEILKYLTPRDLGRYFRLSSATNAIASFYSKQRSYEKLIYDTVRDLIKSWLVIIKLQPKYWNSNINLLTPDLVVEVERYATLYLALPKDDEMTSEEEILFDDTLEQIELIIPRCNEGSYHEEHYDYVNRLAKLNGNLNEQYHK